MNTAETSHDLDTTVEIHDIHITFSPPPHSEIPPQLHPESSEVYRRAFAAELEYLPDIRNRLLDLAQRAGYEVDVEVAISSITDAADEIVDAVEADDPGALRLD